MIIMLGEWESSNDSDKKAQIQSKVALELHDVKSCDFLSGAYPSNAPVDAMI